jgi:hypothetical protein
LRLAIDRANQCRSKFLDGTSNPELKAATAAAATRTGDSEESQARKRRAEAAADRRNKIMAQMNKAQSNFAKEFASDLEKMDTEEEGAETWAGAGKGAAGGGGAATADSEKECSLDDKKCVSSFLCNDIFNRPFSF